MRQGIVFRYDGSVDLQSRGLLKGQKALPLG